ncbi:MAG: hypothetical protein R3B52_02560 [Candidatus Paceibacterota bacterium]
MNNKGQLLIESLVAITVIVISILGIFTLVSRSLSLNRVVNDQYVGTYLAAEGIEVIKNIVDTNVLTHCEPWNQGVNTAGEYQVNYDTQLFGSQTLTQTNGPAQLNFDGTMYSHYSGGQPTKFYRSVTLDPITANHLKVVSLVQWETRGNANFETVLEDHFYNWRPTGINCQ